MFINRIEFLNLLLAYIERYVNENGGLFLSPQANEIGCVIQTSDDGYFELQELEQLVDQVNKEASHCSFTGCLRYIGGKPTKIKHELLPVFVLLIFVTFFLSA